VLLSWRSLCYLESVFIFLNHSGTATQRVTEKSVV
jgi:hypothetical protein